LRVYDLKEENWPARMTLEQLPKVNGRMKSKGTVEQRRKVAQFVDSELSRRRGEQP
jgi:hypothetical protein